jgi:hypothetical protein
VRRRAGSAAIPDCSQAAANAARRTASSLPKSVHNQQLIRYSFGNWQYKYWNFIRRALLLA